MTSRDLLAFLFKWKWTIFGTLGLVVTLVTLLSYVAPRSYGTQATVLVQRASAIPSRQIYGPNQDMIEVLNSEIAILTSRPVMEAVIDRLRPDARPRHPGALSRFVEGVQASLVDAGLIDTLPRHEQWVQNLMKQVRAKAAIESSVITISYSNEDPVLARDVVENVTREYLRRHQEIYSVAGLSGVYVDRMREVEARLARLRAELAGTGRSTRADPNRQVALLEAMNRDRGALATKRGELLDANTRFEAGHPKVRALQAQVNDLERLIGGEGAQLRGLEAAAPRVDRLTTAIASEEQTLRTLRNQYDDAVVTERSDPRLVNVRLVSAAPLPLKPSPSRAFFILIALIAGAIMGPLLAIIREYLDRRPDDIAEIERMLGLPGLGVVPELPPAALA